MDEETPIDLMHSDSFVIGLYGDFSMQSKQHLPMMKMESDVSKVERVMNNGWNSDKNDADAEDLIWSFVSSVRKGITCGQNLGETVAAQFP